MKLWQIFGAEFVLRHMRVNDNHSPRRIRRHLAPVRVDITPEKIAWLKQKGFSIRRGWFGGFTPYLNNYKIASKQPSALHAWGCCLVRYQMAGSKVIR